MGIRDKPRILLVDDHPAVRQALALVLEGEGIGDCREAGGRQEALDAAAHEPPDIALVDLSIGSEDALTLIADFRALHIPVLVCSTHQDPRHVRRAMAAGARGYVTKSEAREVACAVRGVLDGWMLISPRAAEEIGQEE